MKLGLFLFLSCFMGIWFVNIQSIKVNQLMSNGKQYGLKSFSRLRRDFSKANEYSLETRLKTAWKENPLLVVSGASSVCSFVCYGYFISVFGGSGTLSTSNIGLTLFSSACRMLDQITTTLPQDGINSSVVNVSGISSFAREMFSSRNIELRNANATRWVKSPSMLDVKYILLMYRLSSSFPPIAILPVFIYQFPFLCRWLLLFLGTPSCLRRQWYLLEDNKQIVPLNVYGVHSTGDLFAATLSEYIKLYLICRNLLHFSSHFMKPGLMKSLHSLLLLSDVLRYVFVSIQNIRDLSMSILTKRKSRPDVPKSKLNKNFRERKKRIRSLKQA